MELPRQMGLSVLRLWLAHPLRSETFVQVTTGVEYRRAVTVR